MARSVTLDQARSTTTGSLVIESTLGRFNSLSRLWVFCDTPEVARIVSDAPGVHVEFVVAGGNLEALQVMIAEAIEHRNALDAEESRLRAERFEAAS
jgi:hypothetical protein